MYTQEDIERGNRERDAIIRAQAERAAAAAALLAPLARLAAAIAPDVVVRLGGAHYGCSGAFTYSHRVPMIVVYEYVYPGGEENARDAAELDAILLHEIAHYLLEHLGESGQARWRQPGLAHLRDEDAQGDAEALAAALAEEHADELNAPLGDVLGHLSL